jgi:hypothetical protein
MKTILLLIILALTACAPAFDCSVKPALSQKDDWFEWCFHDPMHDFTKNAYGEQRSLKSGQWKR